MKTMSQIGDAKTHIGNMLIISLRFPNLSQITYSAASTRLTAPRSTFSAVLISCGFLQRFDALKRRLGLTAATAFWAAKSPGAEAGASYFSEVRRVSAVAVVAALDDGGDEEQQRADGASGGAWHVSAAGYRVTAASGEHGGDEADDGEDQQRGVHDTPRSRLMVYTDTP
jgi:hypothetical protein